MNDRKQAFDDFADAMLDSAISGINQVVAVKQREVNYWKDQANLTNQQLLILLEKRIATGEIKRELTPFGHYLMTETEQGIFKVDLSDGRLTEPNKEVKNA